ncbi:MAG: general secretion pathway protein GspK [bacterium]
MVSKYDRCEGLLRKVFGFAAIGDRGIALMMILWVLIMLDIIVLQFAASMRTESEITRNFRDRIEAYYLARAAAELAQYELTYVASLAITKDTPVANKYGAVDFRPQRADRDANPVWKREVDLGGGAFRIEYHVKEDRYDLNYLAKSNQKDLEDVLVACGVEAASAHLSMLKNAIIDWADADSDLSGPDSAEDDWYEDNWKGYECKDDRFYSVAELALIRGLRLEGDETDEERDEKKRLLSELYARVTAHPFLTHNKPNRNFINAPTDDVKNEPEDFENLFDDFGERIVQEQSKPTQYDIVATGWVKGSPVRRRIKAEIKLIGGRKIQMLSWSDNYMPVQELDPNTIGEEEETL